MANGPELLVRLGLVGDDLSSFLGPSWVKEADLVKLVLAGCVVDGQVVLPGDAIVPSLSNNETIVFSIFFNIVLHFPFDDLLPQILRRFRLELPQLSPTALVRIVVFDRPDMPTSGFVPSADLFASTHTVAV